jgi:ribose transport system substrate-binding protein
MTKRLRACLAAGAVACGFALAGDISLAFDQGDLIKPVDKPLTLIFVPKVIHPWYDVVQAGLNKSVEELKAQGIEVEVIWDAPPQADVADQNRRIETAIGRSPDAIAVSCLDPATNVQLLQEAKSAGVPVITFDTFCSDDFNFIGHKQDYQDGYDLAEFLAERIGDEGKVGILSGSLTAANHADRVRGFKEAMAKHSNIQIVFEQPDEDNLERAVSLTENALQAHPDLKGIFGSNASNPIGAARAVVNAGKAGQITIVGMDDLPETLQFIEDGVIAGVKAQRQWEIGYWLPKYMVAMYQNHTIPKEHATGSQILTKETLSE